MLDIYTIVLRHMEQVYCYDRNTLYQKINISLYTQAKIFDLHGEICKAESVFCEKNTLKYFVLCMD